MAGSFLSERVVQSIGGYFQHRPASDGGESRLGPPSVHGELALDKRKYLESCFLYADLAQAS